MKKIALFFFLFCLSATLFADIVITKQWEKSTGASSNYSWVSGSNIRDMDYAGGNLYFQDKGNKKIFVVNATDGSELTPIATNAAGAAVAALSDGTLLTSLSFASTSKLGVAYWTGSALSTLMDGATVITATPGRIDFFDAYGTLTDGVIVATSTNTADAVCYWTISNSVVANPLAPTILSNKFGTAGKTSADAFIVDNKNFWVSYSENNPVRFMMNDDKTDASTEKFTGAVKPNTGASGIAQFTYRGRTYVVCAETVYGSIGFYDITDGLASAVLVGSKTAALGTASDGGVKHCPIAINYGSDYVEIFVYATNNGFASYKFYDNTPVTAIQPVSKLQLYVTNGNIVLPTEAGQQVDVFTVTGQRVFNVTAESTETTISNLPKQQVYIVRTNGQMAKVVL